MAKVTGTFYGESRVFAYPTLDLNGVAPNSPVTPVTSQNPLQLTDEGDGSWWRVFGHSAVVGTPGVAGGGLLDVTPLNIQIKRQDTGELLIRSSNVNAAPNANVDLGAPLEHVCGKAGNPGYMSYAWDLPAGTRLIPIISNLGTVTASVPQPVYLVAHAALRKNPGAAKVQLGSKNAQQMKYRGHWTSFTGRFNYSTTNILPTGETDTLTLQVNTNTYFFIDSLWCRGIFTGNPAGSAIGVPFPKNDQNCLYQEDNILVSLRDTTQRSPFTVPGYVPLWSIFGPTSGRYYHPPTLFVVRPNGNIEIDIQAGVDAVGFGGIYYPLEFTVGGVLVEKPDAAIVAALQGA